MKCIRCYIVINIADLFITYFSSLDVLALTKRLEQLFTAANMKVRQNYRNHQMGQKEKRRLAYFSLTLFKSFSIMIDIASNL